MRVISKKKLREFWELRPEAKAPLAAWFKILQKSSFEGFNDLRNTFGTADLVDGLTVFNVGGNKYRVIAGVHYTSQVVYIKDVLTHADYDRGGWKKK
jgi:mRNA interferase HigB